MLKIALKNVHLLVFVLVLYGISNAVASSLERRSIQTKPVKINVYQANQREVNIVFEIEDGWVMYANDAGDTGYPLKISVNKSSNLDNFSFTFPKSDVSSITYHDKKVSYVYRNHAVAKMQLVPSDPSKPIQFTLNIAYGVCNQVCMVFNEDIQYMHATMSDANYGIYNESYANSLLKLLVMTIFALAGGFLLNLMPCVLPVLSIKTMSILKSRERSKADIRKNMMYTVLGILASFVILSISVILLKSLGHSIGWGMHFQEPIFLMIVIVIILFFAHNLWGKFEINLPSRLVNFLVKKSDTHSTNLANFFTGMLGALLATPCTAPLLSTSIAFAIIQPSYIIFIIYVAAGIGMSLPYLLIMILPEIAAMLPKPGQWMKQFKRFLAIVLIITACWLLYVLSLEMHVYNFILFIIVVIIGQHVLLKTKFQNRYIMSITGMLILLVIVMTPHYLESHHEDAGRNHDKYLWKPYSKQALKSYLSQNKIVFLDVTAEWCITCKYNHHFVLAQHDISELLLKSDVVMVRANYTNKSKEIDDLMQDNQSIGVPLNVIYCNQHKYVLPTMLTLESILEAISSCNKQLQLSIRNFAVLGSLSIANSLQKSHAMIKEWVNCEQLSSVSFACSKPIYSQSH